MSESLAEDVSAQRPNLAQELPLAQASKRLARAFERLQTALSQRRTGLQEAGELKAATELLAGENATLTQDKQRLELLLLETANQRDALQRLTESAAQKLGETINTLDQLLAS